MQFQVPEGRKEGSRCVEGASAPGTTGLTAHTPSSPGRGGPRRGGRGSELLKGWGGRFWRPAGARFTSAGFPVVPVATTSTDRPPSDAPSGTLNRGAFFDGRPVSTPWFSVFSEASMLQESGGRRRGVVSLTSDAQGWHTGMRRSLEVAVDQSVAMRPRAFHDQGNFTNNVEEPIPLTERKANVRSLNHVGVKSRRVTNSSERLDSGERATTMVACHTRATR